MSSVRIRVVTPQLTLEFTGREAFFDQHVSPLLEGVDPERSGVEAAAARGSEAGAPTVPAANVEPAEMWPESVGKEARERVEPSGFVPQSGQFSTFLQKVGSRAEKPEQQVVAFAFYLWNYEDRRHFLSSELEGCFEAVGLTPPDPLDACLEDLCQRKRFLGRPANEQEGFLLTPKGVNYVKTRLLASI